MGASLIKGFWSEMRFMVEEKKVDKMDKYLELISFSYCF